MQDTALIVQIKQAVMVIGVKMYDRRIDQPVAVGRDGRSFINI